MEKNGFASDEELGQLTEDEYAFFMGRFEEIQEEIEAILADPVLADAEKVKRVEYALEKGETFAQGYFVLRGIRQG